MFTSVEQITIKMFSVVQQVCYVYNQAGQCVGLITLQSSCADRPEIWDSQPAETLRACNMPLQVYLYLYITKRKYFTGSPYLYVPSH